MSKFTDFLGTLKASFTIGLGGVRLKNSSGNLEVKNDADSAYAEITASKATITGADIILDSADDALTISNNAAQSGALQIIFPPAKSTDGMVLAQKAGTGAGIIELELVSAANTAPLLKMETTSLAFGTSSPVALFSTGAADVISKIEIVIDTAFTGTPSLSIGVAGTTSKYMAATDIDLTKAASTIFEVSPGIAAAGAEDLIATYAAGGASAGAARIIVYYASPA